MIRGRPRISDTIPKLDSVECLFETLLQIGERRSLDEVRLNLIELRRTSDRKTRKDLRPESRPRTRLLDNPTSYTFWSNAREAVRELMRLGMVKRARMPNTVKEFEILKASEFELTAEGCEFIDLGKTSVWDFRDAFFCAMYVSHPYLRALRQRLVRGELFIPRVPRTDIPGESKEWEIGPPEPLDELVEKVVDRVKQVPGQGSKFDKVLESLKSALDKTWSLHPPRGDAKTVTRWVVKLVNEQIVHAVAASNDISMDFIAFRHAVSLLSDFHVCWETRGLNDREGWTIWLTAGGEETDGSTQIERSPARQVLDGKVWIRRRTLPDDTILQQIVDTVLSRKTGGFSLIHEVRADVCHKLQIHGWNFDSALRRILEGEVSHNEFDFHVDAGGGHHLPASEEGFFYKDRPFYLIALVNRRGA